MTEKFEPVAIMRRSFNSYTRIDYCKGSRELPSGEYDLFTAAQMRQAERDAYEDAINDAVEALPLSMDSNLYKDCVESIRALIEQESK